MIASATADQYERSLRILLADDAVDAVVTIFVSPLAARAAEVARAVAAAADAAEEAVRALAQAARYARHRSAPADPPFEPVGADTAAAAAIVAAGLGLGQGEGWLPPGDVERLLRCWAIPVVASRIVASAHAAGEAQRSSADPSR